MRNAPRAGRMFTALAASVIVAGSGLLAACGSTTAGSGTSSPQNPPSSVNPGGTESPAPSQTPGQPTTASKPKPGSQAEAEQVARELLSQLVLPPGASPASLSSLPTALKVQGPHPGTVDLHKVFTLKQPMSGSYQFLLKHVPAGMKVVGHGQTGNTVSGISSKTVSYSPVTLQDGIYQAQLVAVTIPHSGGSLMRADAQVIWFPPRSDTERLDPASFFTVTVSANLFNGGSISKSSQLFRDQATISRLTRLLNDLPAAPHVTSRCPAVTAVYRLLFTPRAGGPDTTVTATACLSDQISVNGESQPALWDTSGALASASRSLLHLSPGSSGSAGS